MDDTRRCKADDFYWLCGEFVIKYRMKAISFLSFIDGAIMQSL